MQRITQKHLDGSIETLNTILGLPTDCWVDGKAQIGHIFDQSVAGYINIEQITNESGATRHLACGNNKREAWEWVCAAIKGAQMMQESLKGDRNA